MTWSLPTKSRTRPRARSRSSYCASNSRTIDCRPHRPPSEILTRSGVDHLPKCLADASMTFSGLMKTVPSDEATHTAIDRSFHESESRKRSYVVFTRDLSNDPLHLGVALGQQHQRRILQINEDYVGISSFKPLYGPAEHFLRVVRNAAPHRIVTPELPHHKIWFVAQNIAVEASDILGNVFHDASAIDQLDPCGGPQSQQFLLHDVGEGTTGPEQSKAGC